MFAKVDFWPEGTCAISDPLHGINFICLLWNLVVLNKVHEKC